MDYMAIVQYLYPQIDMTQVGFQDDSDGSGPYIKYWPQSVQEPTMDELNAAWPAVQALQLRSQQILDAKVYLNSTDWYVIRKSETGVEISQEILDARALARTVAHVGPTK